MGVGVELLQRFPNQSVVPRVVLAQPGFITARPGPRAVAQSIIFVVSHDNTRRTAFNHIPNQMQSFTNSRAAINNIADEYSLTLTMLVNTVYLAVSHLLQQHREGVCTTMDIADDVVTTTCSMIISSHDQLAAISFAQPSLSRQVA